MSWFEMSVVSQVIGSSPAKFWHEDAYFNVPEPGGEHVKATELQVTQLLEELSRPILLPNVG